MLDLEEKNLLLSEECEIEEEEEELEGEEGEEDLGDGNEDEGEDDGEEGKDEEKGEDKKKETFYNPFDKNGSEGEDKNKDDKGEDDGADKKKEVIPPVNNNNNSDIELLKAKDAVNEELDDFFDNEENDIFKSHRKEIKQIAVEAKMKGYNNPIDFATRNVLSPKEWIEFGKQQSNKAHEAIEEGDLGNYDSGRKNVDPSGLAPADTKTDAEIAEIMAKAERGQL